MTWEPTDNLSEDLIRDFEEGFWAAVKSADLSVLAPALQYGGATAANLVDAESRGPLHFAAALNQVDLVDKLLAAGVRASLASHACTLDLIGVNGADDVTYHDDQHQRGA